MRANSKNVSSAGGEQVVGDPARVAATGAARFAADEVVTVTKTAKSFQIPSLDGFRTMSFLIVFMAHAGLNSIVPAQFGVTVFFFLSGYLITTLLRREQEKTGHFSFSRFYLRRVLRILPPFYLILGIVGLATVLGVLPPPGDMASVRALLLHYVNYYIIAHGHSGVLPPGTGVYWSLAVEEHFYFLFPALFFVLEKWRLPRWKQSSALLAVCAVVLLWRCYLVLFGHASYERTGMASETRFDSILFGCVLALTENPALDTSVFSERVWKRWLFPLGLLGLLVGFGYRAEVFRETFRYTVQGLSLIPIFVCAVRYPSWWPMRPLNWRAVAYVGTLSYSLYLVHQLVQVLVEMHLGSLGAIAQNLLALALSFGMSWSIFQLVEKPCARLRKRLEV